MQAHADTLRLFFAVPCPPEQAAAIAQWRDGQLPSGRKVVPENFHLTLAFLGAQPATRLEALKHLAAAIEAPSFELKLDGLIALGKGFVCLRPQSPPAALLQLATSLGQALGAQGGRNGHADRANHDFLGRHAVLRHGGWLRCGTGCRAVVWCT